jgi:hypothetical protein
VEKLVHSQVVIVGIVEDLDLGGVHLEAGGPLFREEVFESHVLEMGDLTHRC